MRRWIGWAAYLYPTEWRRRYGAEFDALLDDASLQWLDLADVVRGALIMRMTTWNSYWKTGAMAAIAGAVLAAAASFAIREQYVAVATVQLVKRPDAGGAPDRVQFERYLRAAESGVLSRDKLIGLIQDPDLDLYREERQHMPLEAIAEEMYRKHVRVFIYPAPGGLPFRISFSDSDPVRAREVVDRLTASFEAQMTREPGDLVLHVLEQPLTPVTPLYPARGSVAIAGGFAGLTIGLLSVLFWRRTRSYPVLLPAETRAFVYSQVGHGGYSSVSDYIRELIRADEQRKSSAHS